MFDQRPNSADDEDELLRKQEEFFKSQQKPGVRIASKSKFAQEREQVRNSRISTDVNSNVKEKNLFDAVQNIPTNLSNIIIGDIVERKCDQFSAFHARDFPKDSVETGFPKVFVTKNINNENKSHSLFLQAIKRRNKEKCNDNIEMNPTILEKSVIVEGPIAKEIHESNIETLKSMSPDEILTEKAKLEKMINPELLEFLKLRRKRGLETINKTNDHLDKKMKTINNEDEQMETDDKELPKPLKELFSEAKQKGWVNMDSLEPEKLKWAEELSTKKEDKDPNEPYNARFDFNGILLPFKDDSVSLDEGLHHHGDEPDRPGYSLQELLQLSRSSTQQQRCTALSTLANILNKSRRGWYDRTLNPAPLCALNEKNVFLLLRFSLDDTSVSVITSTLNALKEFLVNEADEICLSRLFGLDEQHREPELVPSDLKEITDYNELKDNELAQVDVAATAMRSNIVLRIRYILSEIKPSPVGVNCALEILIRLARRSRENALNIATMPNLLNIIVTNFIPFSTLKLNPVDAKTSAYGVPNVTALRLCRVLAVYAGRPVIDKINNMNIINSLVSYLNSDITGQIGIEVQIEALRLWKLLLSYNIARDSVSGAGLTFLSRLQLLMSNHDLNTASELSCEYAGALVSVASFDISMKPIINLLLVKWSTQLATVTNSTWAKTKLVAQTIIALNNISSMNMSWISNDKLFKSLKLSSNLLCAHTSLERMPASLPCLNVLTENGELQPAVSRDSCIPFFCTVINYLLKSSNVDTLITFLSNQHLQKYLEKLTEVEWSFETSWYSRQELLFLSKIVIAVRLIEGTRKVEASGTIWKLSFDLVSALPGDMHGEVISTLRSIFSHEKFKEELLVGQLKAVDLQSSVNFELPNNICERYEKFVSPKGSWSEAALPRDWLYLPLVSAYSNQRLSNNEKSGSTMDVASIRAILILESTVQQLVVELSVSLRFSRICLVFLCEEIYKDQTIIPLLSKVLSEFLKSYHKKIDLSSSVPGLGSFTDLFTALCENFSADSYGDNMFAMVILTFVSQRHDVHYRKSLWSEHAYVLQCCRIKPENLCFPLSELLYPAETDASLIEYYITTLVRKSIGPMYPIPYIIAVHHAALYLKQDTPLAEKMRTSLSRHNEQLYNYLSNYQPPC